MIVFFILYKVNIMNEYEYEDEALDLEFYEDDDCDDAVEM